MMDGIGMVELIDKPRLDPGRVAAHMGRRIRWTRPDNYRQPE